MSEIKLEVGNKYKDRNGTVYTISRETDGTYKFIDDDVCEAWTEDGRYYGADYSRMDLIEEVQESKTLQLEVGKTYICRDGDKVVIERKDYDDTFVGRREIDGTWQYDANGTWTGDEDNKRGIVKEKSVESDHV